MYIYPGLRPTARQPFRSGGESGSRGLGPTRALRNCKLRAAGSVRARYGCQRLSSSSVLQRWTLRLQCKNRFADFATPANRMSKKT